MLDGDGQIRAEYRDDYVLVGGARLDDRLAAVDRQRAFASLAPTLG
jgi:hypothetical protein